MSRRAIVKLVACSLSLAMLIFLIFLIKPQKINLKLRSTAMVPTLLPNDVIGVNLSAYNFFSPSRWDVVAFLPDPEGDEIWCLRVVGLPGESVEITNSGSVKINDKVIKSPDAISSIKWHSLGMAPEKYIVPAGEFFLLGDNPNNANDSRLIGFISIDNIIGKVAGGG